MEVLEPKDPRHSLQQHWYIDLLLERLDGILLVVSVLVLVVCAPSRTNAKLASLQNDLLRDNVINARAPQSKAGMNCNEASSPAQNSFPQREQL